VLIVNSKYNIYLDDIFFKYWYDDILNDIYFQILR
jgi:hypothetical protein